MKPYIGILIDSFWEAINNRVLWALLICWSILLAILAPFGYITERSFTLITADINNRAGLVEKIDQAAKGNGSKSVQAVVTQLDAAFVKRVQKSLKDDDIRVRSSELAEELNKALKSPDIYTEEAFPTAKKRKKLQPLIEMGPEERDEEDNEELNRKLMQLAFPLELAENFGERLSIGYAGFSFASLPFTRRTAREFLEPTILQFIVKFGLGVIAVFIAIIVTSPIIPDTFKSGSLHLLLSKPISRVLLYLSKFFGGTIFVLVNITYFLVGLFLIAGIRFEMWNPGLLYCIPLLVFVFVIFYSISGHIGLIWGNAIVCVVACMLFWFCCFCLGFARNNMRPFIEIFPQINKVAKIEDDVTAVTNLGEFQVWNSDFSVWQPAIASNGPGSQQRTFGPIYDEKRKKIFTKSFMQNPFGGGVFARSRAVNVIDLNNEEGSEPKSEPANEKEDEAESDSDVNTDVETDAGKEEGVEPSPNQEKSETTTSEQESEEPEEKPNESPAEAPEDDLEEEESLADQDRPTSIFEAQFKPHWNYDEGPEIPAQCFNLAEMNGDIVAICRSGFYRLDMEKLDTIEAGEKALFGLLKLTNLVGNAGFEKVTPDGFILSENSSPSVTAEGDAIVVHSKEKLDLLEYREGKFTITKSHSFPAEEEKDEDPTEDPQTVIRMNKNFCVMATEGQPLELFDRDLKPVGQIEWDEKREIKQMRWQPDSNRLSIVLHSGELLFLDCDSQEIGEYDLPLAELVTCINWTDTNTAWVGCRPDSVHLVDFSQDNVLESYTPESSIFGMIYDWAIKPLYTVLPKPAALDEAMLYLLTGKDTQSVTPGSGSIGATKMELSIWPPILSNLAFVAFILMLSCIHVARKEF
ncbi:MAG: ABC transporter permease subunit [Planctomycetota bacterium]